jgi:hypothetical protein
MPDIAVTTNNPNHIEDYISLSIGRPYRFSQAELGDLIARLPVQPVGIAMIAGGRVVMSWKRIQDSYVNLTLHT